MLEQQRLRDTGLIRQCPHLSVKSDLREIVDRRSDDGSFAILAAEPGNDAQRRRAAASFRFPSIGMARAASRCASASAVVRAVVVLSYH